MIKYKIDVFKEMKKYGYNQTVLRENKILSRQTMSNIKNGKSITLDTLNKICILTRLQPGDIIEVVLSEEEEKFLKSEKNT